MYRRYAAECMALSQRRENINDKATLVEMARMWLRLAEFVEKNEGKDSSSSDL